MAMAGMDRRRGDRRLHGRRAAPVSRQDLYERVLVSLHDAALDDARWPAASGLLDEFCGATGNFLVSGDGATQEDVDIFFARFCFRGERDPDLEREYFGTYHALDERVPRPDKVGLRYEGGFRDPLIEQIARAIRAEMLDPAPGGKMLVETLASALGVHILRHRSSLNPASVVLPEARGALDPRRLRRVMDLIEAHPAEELTVERLAAEACLSPFHFARAFRAATGAAPHRYLADRRMARAGTPVADGAVSIVEFAARCGFPSQAAFPRWFTRFAGAPPGDYRRGRLHVGLSAGSGARPRGRSTVGLTVERDGGVATIGPSGRLDTAAADGFADALRDAIAKTERAVILDCRDLDFISSAGLRVVLMAAKDLRTRGAWLVLCALSPPVRQAFRTTGFDRFMPIYENAADARAALEG